MSASRAKYEAVRGIKEERASGKRGHQEREAIRIEKGGHQKTGKDIECKG